MVDRGWVTVWGRGDIDNWVVDAWRGDDVRCWTAVVDGRFGLPPERDKGAREPFSDGEAGYDPSALHQPSGFVCPWQQAHAYA